MKISIIRGAKDKGDVIDADFHSHVNQLPDSNIFVGFMTRQILRQLFNNGDIAESEVNMMHYSIVIYAVYQCCHQMKLYISVGLRLWFSNLFMSGLSIYAQLW